MKINQKNLIIIFIVAIGIFAIVLLYSRGNGTQQSYQSNQQAQISENKPIENDNELMNASNQLTDTNIDGTFDPGIEQNNADAQTF